MKAFSGASKGFMKALNAFMKLFEAPQRSENKKWIFILIQLFEMHRARRIKQNHMGKSKYVFFPEIVLTLKKFPH